MKQAQFRRSPYKPYFILWNRSRLECATGSIAGKGKFCGLGYCFFPKAHTLQLRLCEISGFSIKSSHQFEELSPR